jgi:S1-C subfamily serine protease
MHRSVCGRALVAALLLSGCTHRHGPVAAAPRARPPVAAKPTVAEIVARAARSVVVVQTSKGLGTGFAVSEGIFATNLHVVVGADRILISAPNGKTSAVSGVVGVDPAHDLVLLYCIDANDLPALVLGDDASLRPGDEVIALGTPQGLDLSVSTGVVGAVREVDEDLTLLQITAPISPGSSGGPLFDERGRVVGVTTMFSAQGQNLNFAVPAHYVAALVAHRIQPMSTADFSKLRFHVAKREAHAPGGSPPSSGRRPPFPETIAGFGMGWTLKTAKAACPGKFKQAPNLAECSAAPVQVPFALGPVKLYFAQGKLVSVGLLATSLDDVGTLLSVKYGPADRSYRTTGKKPESPKHLQGVRIEWRLEGGTIVVSAQLGQRPQVNYVSAVWNEENNY